MTTTGQYPKQRITVPAIISGEALERQADIARALLRKEASALRDVNPKLNDHFAKTWETVAKLGIAYPWRDALAPTRGLM